MRRLFFYWVALPRSASRYCFLYRMGETPTTLVKIVLK